MPRPTGGQSLWSSAGEAWTMVADLITATGVWAAIGYGVDRLLGSWPAAFLIGALVGHATGIYMVVRRTKAMTAREQAAAEARRAGVTGEGTARER